MEKQKEKKEIKYIRTLIVEKRNIDFENLIIHNNLYLMTLYIMIAIEILIWVPNFWLWHLGISIAFIFLFPYIFFHINIHLLNEKLNIKDSEKIWNPIKLLLEIDNKSKQLFKNNINDKYNIQNIELLFNELKEERSRKKDKDFSFWNILKVITLPSIISTVTLYEKNISGFLICISIIVVLFSIIFINNYLSFISNGKMLDILDEIEEYFIEYKIIKNLGNNKIDFKKQLEKSKEITYEEASKGLSKNWKEELDDIKGNFNNNKKVKYLKKLNVDVDTEENGKILGNIEYLVIKKTIEIYTSPKDKKEKTEKIFAVKNDNEWELIDTAEKREKFFKKEKRIENVTNIGMIVITTLISIIIFLVVPIVYWWRNKDLNKTKEYTLKNLTQKEIAIKINSEEIKLSSISDSKSEQKKNFKEDNFSIEILNQSNNPKKCEISFKNNSENRAIYFIENECFAPEKIEPYQEEYEYLLSNSTNNDIDLNIESKYYHLEKNHSMIIDLKEGNYSFNIPKQDTNSKNKEKWTELCNWNINYTSKGGLIKILENNDNGKTIYLEKNDNQKTTNNNNQEPSKKCKIINF